MAIRFAGVGTGSPERVTSRGVATGGGTPPSRGSTATEPFWCCVLHSTQLARSGLSPFSGFGVRVWVFVRRSVRHTDSAARYGACDTAKACICAWSAQVGATQDLPAFIRIRVEHRHCRRRVGPWPYRRRKASHGGCKKVIRRLRLALRRWLGRFRVPPEPELLINPSSNVSCVIHFFWSNSGLIVCIFLWPSTTIIHSSHVFPYTPNNIPG